MNCFTVAEHLSSPPGFSGVRVARSLVFVMFSRSLFVLLSFFLSVIVLPVLRFTNSDYLFGIFQLFLDGIILYLNDNRKIFVLTSAVL